MSGYVLAATVFYCTVDGRRRRFTRGDVLPDLPAERVAQLLGSGSISRKGARPADPTPAEDTDTDADLGQGGADDGASEDVPVRPKSAQSTEVWREYGIAVGIPADEVAGMSKKQLQEATR